MVTQPISKSSNGTMFWDDRLLKAYKLASRFAGKKGKIATMPDVVAAKTTADEWSLLWTHTITTTTGEFYGKSKGGIPIVVVAYGVDGILQDREIMKRSSKDLRENPMIKLTPLDFERLEEGVYGPVEVIPHSVVVNMRKYPSSVLSYEQALTQDPLLLARLGPKAADFLAKHKEITLKESGNDFVVTNDHKYHYHLRENAGGLVTMNKLRDYQRCGGEPSSVSTEVYISDLRYSAAFIALNEKGYLGVVSEGLDPILEDLEANWEILTVPTKSTQRKDLYFLQRRGAETFTEYRADDDVMNSGVPEFHVRSLKRVGKPTTFVTEILGYEGLFKYHQIDVKKICPEGANAYIMGEPTIIWEGGNPVKHTAPISFYNADVDTSRVILRKEEVKRDIGLVRRLLSAYR